MSPLRSTLLTTLLVAGAPIPAAAWEWTGNAWADYSAFLGPLDAATKTNLQGILAVGDGFGRVEGRLGQIGDSITESSAYFRNATMNGATNNETGHDYVPIRSWLSYSGLQPPDANSFYRDHGKGSDYGNLGGWWILDAVNTGHPDQGVLVGDGFTPGEYSWALLMFGTNDIDDGSWDAAIWKESYRALVQGYAALGVVPVVSTIPPELAHVGDGRVEAANAAILALAGEEQIPWVDFYGLVLHHQPVNWVGTLIGGDGTHPTAATGGQGFSQNAQTSTDGYALRTKLTWDMAEKLKDIVWDDGPPDGVTDAPIDPPTLASGIRLAPNPFRWATRIRDASGGMLTIVDVTGRRVRSLSVGVDSAATWNGEDDAGRTVPAGVYFVLSRIGHRTSATRIVRVR